MSFIWTHRDGTRGYPYELSHRANCVIGFSEICHISRLRSFWSGQALDGHLGQQQKDMGFRSQAKLWVPRSSSYSICDLNYITQPHWKMGTAVWCDVLSRVLFFAIPWTVASQALLSMGFSRQEFWCCLPFSPPGYLPDPGIKRKSLAPPALAGRFFTPEPLYDLPPKTAMITQCL